MAPLTTVTSSGILDGTIVNADLNASAAIALSKLASHPSVLTGSASNTIPIVTGANALSGQANLQFNGSGDLTVIGNEGTSANLYLRADEGDDNGDGWRIGSNQDDNDLTFANNTSGSYVDKLTLLKTGEFGVGTSDAEQRLNIHEADSDGCFLKVTNSTTGTGNSDGALFGITDDEAAVIWQREDNIIQFATHNTERLRINSDGQISIRGTSTAFDTTGDLDSLQLYYETDSGQASIGPYSSGGSTHLSFYTNASSAAATEKLRITSAGNVNQTIAADAIGFNQTATGNHYIKNIVNANRTGANASILALHAHWNSKDVAAIKFRTGADTSNKDDGVICFETSSANNITERMRIDAAGQVGIGSGAPDRFLHIQEGNANRVVLVESASASGAFIVFKDTNTTDDGHIRVGCDSGDNLGLRGDAIHFKAGAGTAYATIDADGLKFDGDTAAANALDDYEEGTWTPGGLNYGGTVTTNSATYVKIGSLVHLQAYIDFSNTDDADEIYITGLPFTGVGTSNNYSQMSVQTNADLEDPILRQQGGTTQLRGCYYASGGSNGDRKMTYTMVKSKWLIFGGTYRATT